MQESPPPSPPRSTAIGPYRCIYLAVKRGDALWLESPYADDAAYFSKFSCGFAATAAAAPAAAAVLFLRTTLSNWINLGKGNLDISFQVRNAHELILFGFQHGSPPPRPPIVLRANGLTLQGSSAYAISLLYWKGVARVANGS